MSKFFRDSDYSNLIWVEFDGRQWSEYQQLFTDVADFARDNSESIVIAFDPQVDMPKGTPLTYLRWTAQLVKNEESILHMYAIVDAGRFRVGKIFADLAAKVYFWNIPLTVVDSKESAYEGYHKLIKQVES